MTDTICTFSAHGLKCFYCISSTSWDDCEKHQKVQHCESDMTICINMSVIIPPAMGFEMKSFARGCNKEILCDYAKDNFESCKSYTSQDLKGQNMTCDSSCCSTDLCNESAVPAVSVIMLVTCTLWALVR